jgi:hypothetical protein
MLRRRLRERSWHQSGASNRTCANCRADEKGAARLVVLGHAEFLPRSRMAATIRVMDKSMRRFRAGGKRWDCQRPSQRVVASVTYY